MDLEAINLPLADFLQAASEVEAVVVIEELEVVGILEEAVEQIIQMAVVAVVHLMEVPIKIMLRALD